MKRFQMNHHVLFAGLFGPVLMASLLCGCGRIRISISLNPKKDESPAQQTPVVIPDPIIEPELPDASMTLDEQEAVLQKYPKKMTEDNRIVQATMDIGLSRIGMSVFGLDEESARNISYNAKGYPYLPLPEISETTRLAFDHIAANGEAIIYQYQTFEGDSLSEQMFYAYRLKDGKMVPDQKLPDLTSVYEEYQNLTGEQ